MFLKHILCLKDHEMNSLSLSPHMFKEIQVNNSL